MKKLLLLLVPALLALSSCDLFNSNGKKVMLGKSEVFYKDGATEAEAKALADHLLEAGYFDNETPKSAQILRKDNQPVVRLVVNKAKLNEVDNATRIFWYMQAAISENVFDNEPIRLVLVDDKMKELETIDPIATYKAGKSAIIYYNSEAFKKADVKKLAAVFEEQGFFAYEGEKNIFLTKEGSNNVVRMLVDKKLLGDNLDAFMPVYQMLVYKLKADAFDDEKTAMYLTASDDLADIKKVPLPSDEDMAQILEQLNGLNEGGTEFTNNTEETGTTQLTDTTSDY